MRRPLATRLPWRRVAVDVEIDEELAFHVEMLMRRYVDAGLSPIDARAAALERFGDLAQVRETCRDLGHQLETSMQRTELLHELRQDLAYGIRTLRRAPLFAALALVTLAIGIGASTAIFTLVHTVLLRDLPYPEGERIVAIWNRYGGGPSEAAIAPAEYADMREQQRAFDDLAALSIRHANLAGDCGPGIGCEPERVTVYATSPNVFDLLGVQAAAGRRFGAADVEANASHVVMITDALWRRRFGADPTIIGRPLRVNGIVRTVIGIMPTGMRFPDAPVGFLNERADLWIPIDWMRSRTEGRGNQYLGVIARLRSGTPLARAQGDLDGIAARFRAQFPDRYAQAGLDWRIAAVPLRTQMLGDVRPALLVMLGAVGLVLLIACANVANLMLARAATRHRELAIRSALGAARGRLVRQLLTESGLLAGAGAVLGVAVAAIAVRVLVRLDPGNIPRLDAARIDLPVLLFAIVAALVTGLLVGIVPALQHSRTSGEAALTEQVRGATMGAPRRRFRSALVIAEVAMATVVLLAAGLLVRSFVALQRVHIGFDDRGALAFQVTLPRATYDSAAKLVAMYAQLVERLGAMPGVSSASAIYPLPMSGDGWSGSFDIESKPTLPGQPEPHAEYHVAEPGYARTLGVTLMAGRDFTAQDAAGAPDVAVVDEVLARQAWPGESAIGKRINPGNEVGRWATVVGVVAHVRSAGPREAGEGQIYLPFAQRVQSTMYLVVRGTGTAARAPLALAAGARRIVHDLDPDLPVAKMTPVTDLVARGLARERFSMTMLGVFATVALVLAAVGLYGVMGYLVSQRTPEIGVRMALGGQRADIVRLIVGEGLGMTVAGLALGLLAAVALARSLARLLYGVQPTDASTMAAIVVVLALVAVVATYLPARRALRIDPARALRE